MSEGLWGPAVSGGRDEIEGVPSSGERMLRKQVSALQVGPSSHQFARTPCTDTHSGSILAALHTVHKR